MTELDLRPSGSRPTTAIDVRTAFLAAPHHSPRTGESYGRDLTAWFEWCDWAGIDPLDAHRFPHRPVGRSGDGHAVATQSPRAVTRPSDVVERLQRLDGGQPGRLAGLASHTFTARVTSAVRSRSSAAPRTSRPLRASVDGHVGVGERPGRGVQACCGRWSG